MTLQFERKFTLILLFVFLVLTTVGIAFYQSTVSSRQAALWERQTQDIVYTFDEILTLTLDASSGVDAFVLTGTDTYLAPYQNAKKNIDRNLARLRAADSPTPATLAELERLEQTEDAIFERLEAKVALRKSKGYEVAVLELPNADDRTKLLTVRASIERANSAESAQLQAREQQLETSRSRTITILIMSCIAGVGSLAFANFVVFSETSKRSKAERELIDVNRDLETRVNDRTAELRDANDELLRAGEERSRLLEKEQKARREAEIANRLRDEFMATVSHELRTPLNAILGWGRLLRNGSLDTDQSTKAIDTIINNAEMQNRLIEDLLDVARIVSGKLDLDRTDFDLDETVRGTIETIRPAAAEKQIDLVYGPFGGATIVNGDKKRIEQVILNLLTNAVKFSPKGGSVTVAGKASGGDVEINVLDNGVGIRPDFLPMVFERFRQDASTAAGSGGLGLGLAIVRNLVEMHGGSVSVQSDGENRGSEFTVRLPAKAAGSRAAA